MSATSVWCIAFKTLSAEALSLDDSPKTLDSVNPVSHVCDSAGILTRVIFKLPSRFHSHPHSHFHSHSHSLSLRLLNRIGWP